MELSSWLKLFYAAYLIFGLPGCLLWKVTANLQSKAALTF
jgi:hypothetical protein